MKFTMTKIAAGVVLAVMASGAQAATVTSWQLGDFNNDGLQSDFNFFLAPSGSSVNKFAPTGELCGATACAPIAMDGSTQGVNTFTMGFDFGGTGQFSPITYGTGVTADITGGVLTLGALNFGGIYQGLTFNLAPDSLTAVNTNANASNGYTLTDLGGGNYGVVIRYVGTINNPASSFNGYQANWRLEGVMSTATAPVPEASTYGMMLAGLGLVGFAVRRRKLAA